MDATSRKDLAHRERPTDSRAIRHAVDAASDGTRPTKPNPPRVELQRLKPKHHRLLVELLAGETLQEAARRVGLTPNRATTIVKSAVFQSIYRRLETARYEKILHGDYGPIALAREESHGAMRRLVVLSKTAKSEETQRKAINDVLSLAGYSPIKRTENLSLDALFDRMTDDELAHFANTGEWPARLGDALQQLGRDVKIAPTPTPDALDADYTLAADPPDDEHVDA